MKSEHPPKVQTRFNRIAGQVTGFLSPSCNNPRAMKTPDASSTLRDPVCGMTVDPKTAAASSQFRGQTFYFCSAHCRQKFDASPASFVDQAAPAAGGCGCGSAQTLTVPQDHRHEQKPPAKVESGCCGGTAKTAEESCCQSGHEAELRVYQPE